MKTIKEFDIIIQGPEWPDYWQGQSLGDYDDMATGIGYSEAKALDDAMESLAQAGWDTESNPDLLIEINTADDTDLVAEMEEEVKEANGGDGYEELGESPYVYATIRVKGE